MKIFEKYKDIKSYTNTKFNNNIFDFIFVRPISIFFTIPFAKTNISPNLITFLRIIFQMICLILLIVLDNNYTKFLVISHFFVADIFDYVDGNLARYKNKATYFGKLFDTTFDNSLNILFLVLIIFHLDHNNFEFKYLKIDQYYLIISIYIIFFWFEKYSKILADIFFKEVKVLKKSTKSKSINKDESINIDKNKSGFNVLKFIFFKILRFSNFLKINCYGFLPYIFFILGEYELYYLVLFIIFFTNFIIHLPLNFRNYFKNLNIHRISVMDIKN